MFVILAVACSGLRLRFLHAAALAGVLDLAFAASLLLSGVRGETLAYDLALLGITTTVALVVAHSRDQGRRRHFLEVLALQSSRSKLARLSERLRRLSLSDELTGLPNRRELEARLDAALATARRGAQSVVVAMIDIDRFKEVNDQLGHAAGDAVLRQVASVLVRALRAGDSAFRLGGDELCVMMPGARLEDGVEVVERALAGLRTASQRAGVEVTFSAGCAESLAGEDRGELLRRADAALYRAKRAGGRRVHAARRERGLLALQTAS